MRTLHPMSAACGFVILAVIVLATLNTASAATLEVGPGKPFSRIEEANAKAQAGDVILVYPRARRPALRQNGRLRAAKEPHLPRRSRRAAKPYVAISGLRVRLQRRRQHAAGDLPVQPGSRQLHAGRLRTVRGPQLQP